MTDETYTLVYTDGLIRGSFTMPESWQPWPPPERVPYTDTTSDHGGRVVREAEQGETVYGYYVRDAIDEDSRTATYHWEAA